LGIVEGDILASVKAYQDGLHISEARNNSTLGAVGFGEERVPLLNRVPPSPGISV